MRSEDTKIIKAWAKEQGIDSLSLSVFPERRGPRPKPGFRYRPVGIPGLSLDKGMAVYVKEPVTEVPIKEEPARAKFTFSTLFFNDD